MSSIPSSAMPHARVHEDEPAPRERTPLLRKAGELGRGAATFAAGSVVLPVTAGLAATAVVMRWLDRRSARRLQPAG